MTSSVQHEVLSESIIKTLLYFDLFNYPLTSQEVFRYISINHVTELDVKEELERLSKSNVVWKLGDFFSVQNNKGLEDRRKKGNALAKESLTLAYKKAKLVSRFPFVKAVMISGSLSKGYMDEKSDFDYFIVTSRNRLWIARTLLVVYKRIFLLNSHKYFCVNYFVDEDHLEIEEKNLFTATELATLIPVIDNRFYYELMNKNRWLQSFFPHYHLETIHDNSIRNPTRNFLEKFINLFFGNSVEKLFMRISLNRWKKRYKKNYSETDFEIAFKTKEYVSKNHPNNYQRKIMDLYTARCKAFVHEKQLVWPV